MCRTHTWTYRCSMHGTSMGTIHLSRNLADAHAMYIASIRGALSIAQPVLLSQSINGSHIKRMCCLFFVSYSSRVRYTLQWSTQIKCCFFSILLTHEGSHKEVYRDFQPSLTSSAGGAKGCSDHRFRAPLAYTAQLPTLHQHRANNQ